MWIVLALGAAFFAGLTSILSKQGVRDLNSNLATSIRTTVVLFNAWIVVAITNSYLPLSEIPLKTLIFLFLSGVCTGGAWLCFFKALKMGPVSFVEPIDKSSTVLTIILAIIFLGEALTFKIFCGIILLLIGTYTMVSWKRGEGSGQRGWLIYALLAAVFSALTSILAKIGIEDIDSNLATALRTFVVLVIAWGIVIYQNKVKDIRVIDRRTWFFLIASGFATGFSWLCFYAALKSGTASAVVPIDKLSIVFTIVFSCIFLGEKVTKKSWIGLAFIVTGTLLLIP